MLKLGRVTKFKMLFLVLVFVFNFDLFKFSAAILEKGLLAPFYRLTLLICIEIKFSMRGKLVLFCNKPEFKLPN